MKVRRDDSTNDYGNLVEAWKVRLITRRARRLGFRRQEWKDLQQEIILNVLDFRYDPAKSNGAKESTLLTAIVDNRLKAILRTSVRDHNRIEQIRRDRGIGPSADENHPAFAQADDLTPMSADVRQAVQSLSPREQAICAALGHGESPAAIAKQLNCGRTTIRRHIENIRQQMGSLRGWIGQ